MALIREDNYCVFLYVKTVTLSSRTVFWTLSELPLEGNEVTITNSASAVALSNSASDCVASAPAAWPPTAHLFTALRPSILLIEGAVKRKTVARLIPPGLEMSVSVDRGDFSGGLDSGRSSNTTPQHLGGSGGFGSSWKTYWASLVAVDSWTEVCILYFEANADSRLAIQREDVSSFWNTVFHP